MTSLPPEISFGYVVGRWVMAVADTEADPDEYPDAAIPTGTVVFTRIDANVSLLDTTQNDGTWVAVARKNVTATLNADGELSLPHLSSAGVWLIVGEYTVSGTISGTSLAPFTINVTTEHTTENPLDVLKYIPYVNTPITTYVASPETAERAEAAALRAEAAADGMVSKDLALAYAVAL